MLRKRGFYWVRERDLNGNPTDWLPGHYDPMSADDAEAINADEMRKCGPIDRFCEMCWRTTDAEDFLNESDIAEVGPAMEPPA